MRKRTYRKSCADWTDWQSYKVADQKMTLETTTTALVHPQRHTQTGQSRHGNQ